MIEKLLDTAKKAVDAAEVYEEKSEILEVLFEAGKLKSVERKTSAGIGLRVVDNGRIGFSSSTDPGKIDELVAHAKASARFGKKVTFSFPQSAGCQDVETVDASIEAYTAEQAVEEGKKTVDMLRDRVPNGLTDISFTTEYTTSRILNTSGLDLSTESTGFSHGIVSVIIEGDSILWIGDGGQYGTLDIRTDSYVDKIAALAKHSEKIAPKTKGKLPVLFTAEEMPNLLSSIEIGVDGLRLIKGDSPLIGREGEKVLGAVTLSDNPLLPHAPGSRPFDDEGVPSNVTPLFTDGVFNNFLFDLDTAAKAGTVSTGSAARHMLSMPGISTSNLMMKGGTETYADLIAGMKEGIIVHGVLGGGQSNLVAGDFALNIMLGFLVRDGEIAGRLQNTMVSGNIYDAFPGISAMTADVKQVGPDFVPDVLFSSLSVSSS